VGASGKARSADGKESGAGVGTKQFHFEKEKFQAAGLTPMGSQLVKPARAKECPVHREARVLAVHELRGERLEQLGGGVAAEVEVVRVHVASDLVIKDRYVDAEKCSPLIYNFRHYFRLRDAELGRTFRAEV
jgi:flavin reductase (DIM6/NTAB) family NADH-FMN oxidoreductase RutF